MTKMENVNITRKIKGALVSSMVNMPLNEGENLR